MDVQGLSRWLSPLDALPLECDGMTRVISNLLLRDGVAHRACYGALRLQTGGIDLHCWIQLQDGVVCDYRARMWLGSDAPHGVFVPEPMVIYEVHGEFDATVSPLIFPVLSGFEIGHYPSYRSCIDDLLRSTSTAG